MISGNDNVNASVEVSNTTTVQLNTSSLFTPDNNNNINPTLVTTSSSFKVSTKENVSMVVNLAAVDVSASASVTTSGNDKGSVNKEISFGRGIFKLFGSSESKNGNENIKVGGKVELNTKISKKTEVINTFEVGVD